MRLLGLMLWGLVLSLLIALAPAEAADQAFSEKAALSLALNPNEAQYLALSAKQGSVDVIVRGLGDVELHPMEIASFKRLIK